MKLSIFPEALAHPIGREQKNKEAFKTSNPYMPEVVHVFNEQDLIDVVSNYAWSASVFAGYRLKANFVTADFIAIDVDSGLSIDDAYKICEANRLTSLCLPSPSYTDEKPRFRIVFPLETTISNQNTYDATWARLRELFPMLDESCSDSSRFFYACRTDMDVGFWLEADLLKPITPVPKQSKQSMYHKNKDMFYDGVSTVVLEEYADLVEHLYKEERSKVPEAVAFFMENAHTGIDGGWWNSLNKFVFVLTLQGCDIDDIIDVVEELAPNPLDDRDHRCIDVAHNDGMDCRVDELEKDV